MDKIEEAMEGYWGKRCPDYEPECMVCKAWEEYDTVYAEKFGVLWTKEALAKMELLHANLIKNSAVPFGNGGWLVPYKR